MPRHARLDAPGALHHIICRGIERRSIFRDEVDRSAFVERLGTVVAESGTTCYAWTLLPNHVHLLFRTGATSLSTVMRRLLTGYAGAFNRRHHRHGYLFQNRYKSILCQEQPYFLELIRYLHLNPIRAGIVENLSGLDRCPWTGHSTLLGWQTRPWQATEDVLGQFSNRLSTARRLYRAFIAEGTSRGHRPELTGGGLLRSAGGWRALTSLRRQGNRIHGDERILGDSEFVEATLRAANERRHSTKSDPQRHNVEFDRLLRVVAARSGLDPADLLLKSKRPLIVQARSLLCFWAVRRLALPETTVAARLGLTQPAISQAVHRGERSAKEERLPWLG